MDIQLILYHALICEAYKENYILFIRKDDFYRSVFIIKLIFLLHIKKTLDLTELIFIAYSLIILVGGGKVLKISLKSYFIEHMNYYCI